MTFPKFLVKYILDGVEYEDWFDDIELAFDRFKRLTDDKKMASIYNFT